MLKNDEISNKYLLDEIHNLVNKINKLEQKVNHLNRELEKISSNSFKNKKTKSNSYDKGMSFNEDDNYTESLDDERDSFHFGS